MTDPRPVLVLTRPEPQSRAFLADCEAHHGRPLHAVVSPALQIKPVPYDVDLDRFQTLIVTSQNALDHVDKSLVGRQVATVGKRTAERAAELGANSVCLGETVETFLENAESLKGPALHLRGVHSRGALADRLNQLGVLADECVVYDQLAKPLSEGAKSALANGMGVVPVFSPRTATLVSRYPVHPETQVLAISQATSEAWTAAGRLTVADQPNHAAMRDLVVQAF